MESLDLLRRARLDVARDGTPARPRAAAPEARHARRLSPRRVLAPALLFGALGLSRAVAAWSGSDASASLSALRAALETGDLPRAVREGEAAIRADPASSEAQDLLGRAYGLTAQGSTLLEQMRLARRARTCFARAVELDPSNVAALSDLARYDMRAPGMLGGGKKKAREIIGRVAALDPERGHVLLGELAEVEKKPAEAEAEFRLALAAAPHGERGRRALSDFLVSQKRYGEARGLWLEARDSEAHRVLADYELAGIAIVSGEGLEPAARALEESLSARGGFDAPTPASIHERLAVVYERLGRNREAAAELEAAVTLEPDRSDWRRRLARLEQ